MYDNKIINNPQKYNNMKKYSKHIAIVIFLVLAQIGAFTLKANAQNKKYLHLDKADVVNIGPNGVNATELIADETTIKYKSSSNTATIECDNEEIAQKLLRRYDQIIKRCTWGYKKDRHGEYKHYLIVVNINDAKLITEWAKTNL